MSKQAYHAMTMYASARKTRKAATGSDFATATTVTDPGYKYEGQMTPSHKIDIASKSGSDEQSAMILSYAWGEVVHDVGNQGDSYLGSAYMSHMTDLVLVFEEGVKFKDNIHLLDESENRQWLPSGHMIRIPLVPTGDRWNVADQLSQIEVTRRYNIISGSSTMTVLTEGLSVGDPVSGSAGIPPGTTIASIDSATTLTMSANAFATANVEGSFQVKKGSSSGEGGKMHSPFHTSLDMVLPLEELNSGGISYKLFYADVDSTGSLSVVTGEHLASFGLHMQITGPDIGR